MGVVKGLVGSPVSSFILTSSELNLSHSRPTRVPIDPKIVVKPAVIAPDTPALPPIAIVYAAAIQLPAATPAPCIPANIPPATGPVAANPMTDKVNGKATTPTPNPIVLKRIAHLLAFS